MNEMSNLEAELFNKTKHLYNNLMEAEDKILPIVDFRLSEIHTLKRSLQLYLSLNEEFSHYEITSLLSFWENAFVELKDVVANNDRNTSWLYSSFESYKNQHEIVASMLSSKI